ncbi:MAG: tetratricopeptide repeat protein [Geobacteraceae bacterium]|nr:tetratricopeptide repeat protein [Geobacteraceae bacterium]
MSFYLVSHIRIGILYLTLLMLAGYPQIASAAPRIELERVRIEQDVNTVRIVLGFDRIPLYEIRTSGQKVEVTLLDAFVEAGVTVPDDNESIARILIGESSQRLLLSFLLRRPPVFVNAVKREQEKEIALDIYWREQERGMRPAISRSLPGGIHIGPVGGVSRRMIASKYNGQWDRFFNEYERFVELDIPLDYTLPPFPALALYLPARELVPGEVLDAGQIEKWDIAKSAYSGTGFENLSFFEAQVRNLVLADIALREDKCSTAHRFLDAFATMQKVEPGDVEMQEVEYPEQMELCADMLSLYSLSCEKERLFKLLAELGLAISGSSELGQQPYVTLLQAEAELAAGRSQIVLQLLEGLRDKELKPSGVLQRRGADARFKQGDLDFALKAYPELDAAGQLENAPYSLGLYAQALYKRERYPEAQEIFSRLYDQVEKQDLRDLIKYYIAKSMLHAGKSDAALKLLSQIMPGSYAAKLAQLKLADLSVVNSDIESRKQALDDYTQLRDEMPTRMGKAEVQFKQALTNHLLQRPEQAIAILRDFLHRDRASELRPYAQALLAEILPPYIEYLLEQEQHFDAMLLLEKNRDILVATQRNYAFLLNIGEVFSALEFYPRAVKLYQYVIDATEGDDKLEPVYIPLVEALYALGDYPNVVMYAQRYLDEFEDAGAWHNEERAATVYLHYVKALLELGREAEVETLLRADDRPRSNSMDRFAARYFWRKNDVLLAGEQLRAVVESGNAEMQDLYVYAESLYAQQDFAPALEYYQRLSATEEYRLPALYRMGNILLEQGERERGLTFLTRVAESNGDSRWKRLAQQSLLMQRLD